MFTKRSPAHHAKRSYSPQIRTNSSRWWGPRIEESRVRYSKLSMMTATNRFSIWTETWGFRGDNRNQNVEKELLCESYQEGAEEDEGDKVAVSKVCPTASLVVRGQGEGGEGGVWLTLLTWQTGEHDLLPGLPCCTPSVFIMNIRHEGTLRMFNQECWQILIHPPEQKHESTEKSLEVIVLIDVTLVIQLDVPKYLWETKEFRNHIVSSLVKSK